MFKLIIVFIAIFSLCECFGNGFLKPRKRVNRRSGYGYDPMSSYESMGYESYEPYKSYGHQDYGHDLMAEYGSDYGLEAYGGGHGGGYESYAPKAMPYMPAPKYSDYGHGYDSYKPPVYMKKSYEMAPMYGKGYGKQYDIKVPSGDSPVKVMFLTQHTPVHIQQRHKKGQPEYKKSTTHEEPHVVVHEVIKPVIQEIREIIVPYRKVVQRIEPVKEEVKTIVAKNDGKDGDDGDSYRKYRKYEDEDDDKKYKRYHKDDDDDDKYKRYHKEDDDDKYKRYRKDDDDEKYKKSYHKDDDDEYKKYHKYDKDDKYDRSGYSHQYYEQHKNDNSNNNPGVLSGLSGLASSGTMNNGMTLAAIYGGGEQSSDKKSS